MKLKTDKSLLLFLSVMICVLVVGCSNSSNSSTTTDEVNSSVNTNSEVTETESKESQSKTTLDFETAKKEAIRILESNYGKFGDIKVEESNDLVLFSVPSPSGFANEMLAAKNGDTDKLAEYNTMMENLTSLSKSLYEFGECCNKKFALGVQNDLNTGNVLISILNGTVMYSYVTVN